MKKLFLHALIVLLAVADGTASAQDDARKNDYAKNAPTLIVNPANPAVTRFIFLETKADFISKSYSELVERFVRTIAQQPGFRAGMTLEDIDHKHIVVYYQFENAAQYDALRTNPVPAMKELANTLQNASSRFEDIGATPTTQIPGGQPANTPPTPVPGYYAEFRYGDGVGINEAVANPGRNQAEVTYLMEHAGLRGATPQDAPGFKEFTFHIGADGMRNMNLLRYDSVEHMTIAAIYPLSQGLINGGGTGGTDWYGPNGPAKLGLHVYRIVGIIK
jgi:hypothetical protein